MNEERLKAAEEAWESGDLGTNPDTIRRAEQVDAERLRKSLNLTQISIRLQDELITEFKRIASEQGIGYQPLMRQALHKFLREYQKKPAEVRSLGEMIDEIEYEAMAVEWDLGPSRQRA